MSQQDNFSRALSDFVQRAEQAESDKLRVKDLEEKRRIEFQSQWRAACNQVVVPLFEQVKLSFAESKVVSVHLVTEYFSVSLRVKTPTKDETLCFSVDATRERVVRSGIPTETGLSRALDSRPVEVGLDGLTAHSVRNAIEAFLRRVTSDH